MSHLNTARVLSVLIGEGSAEDHVHLEGCSRCRSELEAWRPRLADMRELESNAVDEAELHNLRVLYRWLGPSSEATSWLARLIRAPQLATDPVRGGVAASLDAYGAGPYRIVLQVRPSDLEGRFDVHGQVADEAGAAPEDSEVILTSAEGHADRAQLDDFGEFRLVGVPKGTSRLVWVVGDARIELPGLTVGERDDDSGR